MLPRKHIALLICASILFDALCPFWALQVRRELELFTPATVQQYDWDQTWMDDGDGWLAGDLEEFAVALLPPAYEFGSNTSSLHVWRTLQNNNYVFELYDGSGVRGEEVGDLATLVSLLPFVSHINSDPLLSWLDGMDSDHRREVLIILEPVPIEGGSADLVEKLHHFRHVEKHIAKYQATSLRITSGQFLIDLALMSEEVAEAYGFSKSILYKAIIGYAMNMNETESESMTTSTELVIWQAPHPGWGWAAAGFFSAFLLGDIIFGMVNGNWASVGVGLGSLLFGVLGALAGVEKIQKAIGKLMEWSTKVMKNISKGLGAVSALISGAFSIYGTVKDIESIKSGQLDEYQTKMAIVSLVANLVNLIFAILSLILIAFATVTAILGAIAAILGLVFTIVQFFMAKHYKSIAAKQAVARVSGMLALTQAERDREYENFKNDRELSEYLKELIQQKYANNQLVNGALQMLGEERSLQMYVTAGIEEVGDEDTDPKFYLNNEAYMDTGKSNIRLARWSPDQTSYTTCCPLRTEPHIDCAPETTDGVSTLTMYARRCVNAFAVRETRNRLADTVLFDFKDGTDRANGPLSQPNVFLVQSGDKNFKGGTRNDTFLLQSNQISGTLNGNGGNNTLSLVAANMTWPTVVVDLLSGTVTQTPISGASSTVRVQNMQLVSGREWRKDVIIPDCKTMYIAGNGGEDSNPDTIQIKHQSCNYTLTVDTGNNTQVSNENASGGFVYRVGIGRTELNVDYSPSANHTILLLFDLETLTIGSVDVDSQLLQLGSPKFELEVNIPSAPPEDDEMFHEQPFVFTNGNSMIRIKSDEDRTLLSVWNITETRSSAVAPPFGETLFLLNSTVSRVVGHDGNDTFVLGHLVGSRFTGTIDGGLGENSLVLEDEFRAGETLDVDMTRGSMGGGSSVVQFSSIQQFTGRKGETEHVQMHCDDYIVIPNGGKASTNPDKVNILTPCSNTNFTTIIKCNAFMEIENHADGGQFVYLVPMEKDIRFVHLSETNLNTTTHLVQFEFGARALLNGTVEDGQTIILRGANDTEFRIPIFQELDEDAEHFNSPLMLTNETAIVQATVDEPHEFKFIFNLTADQPQAEIYGSGFAKNIFVVHSHFDLIMGGAETDMFILHNDSFSGLIDAGPGRDVLVVDGNYSTGNEVTFDLSQDDVPADSEGGFRRLEEFIGRNDSSDRVIAGCGIHFIDGGDPSPDFIQIADDPTCTYSMHIMLRSQTELDNRAEIGDFAYSLYRNGTFDFINKARVNHTALIQFGQQGISNITFSDGYTVFERPDGVLTRISTFQRDGENGTYYSQPRMVSEDLIEFRVRESDGAPMAIFELGENVTEKIGFKWLTNAFLIGGNGDKLAVGGDLNDTFILQAGNVTVQVHGYTGHNVFAVSEDVEGDVTMVSILIADGVGIGLLHIDSPNTVLYSNITVLVGSNGSWAETFYTDCHVEMVDGSGGGPEFINVEDTKGCNYTSTTLVIYTDTQVINSAPNGSFFYPILNSSQGFDLGCNDCWNGSHVFVLTYSTDDMQAMGVNKTSDCSISTRQAGNSGDPNHDIEYTITGLDAHWCLYPDFLTSDLLRISVTFLGTKMGMFRSDDEDKSVAELIRDWQPKATRLNMTMFISANEDEVISIGRPGGDFILSSPDVVNHLVGNGGDNIYAIHAGENTTNTVYIYGQANENETELIDLSMLVKPLRQRDRMPDEEMDDYPGKYYVPLIRQDGDDLVVEVSDVSLTEDVTIILVNGVDWYEHVQVILTNTPLEIIDAKDHVLTFVPVPIQITTQEIVIVDEEYYEANTPILINRDLPDHNSVLVSGNSLLITTAFNDESDKNFVTIAFEDFIPSHSSGKRGGNQQEQQQQQLPRNVHLDFSNGASLTLEHVQPSVLPDLVEVLIAEKTKLEYEVFGFKCEAVGLYPDPRRCNTYHECRQMGDNGWLHYEFICPAETIFCSGSGKCGYPSTTCICSSMY